MKDKLLHLWEHIESILTAAGLIMTAATYWLHRTERLVKMGRAVYDTAYSIYKLFTRRRNVMEILKKKMVVDGCELGEVKASVVDGKIDLDVVVDLPKFAVAELAKHQNVSPILTGVVTVAAGALSTLTKDIGSLNIGKVHDVAILGCSAKIVSGSAEIEIATDLPQIGVELAKESENKIDDIVAETIQQMIKAVT